MNLLMPAASWAEFKTLVTNKSLRPQYIELAGSWEIFAKESIFVWQIGLTKGSSDATDFENNHKANYNKSLETVDADGSSLTRGKVTKTGWSYQPHAIEFTTSLLNSVYNKDSAGNDLGFASIKFYDASNNELTTQGTIDTDCVKTEIDWMPTHDFEIVAGRLNQATQPNQDVRIWVIGLPGIADVAFSQGGINLKHVQSGGQMNTDGRAPKLLLYNNPIPGTNKFRIVLRHPAGYQHNAQFIFEIFKA